MSGSNVTETTGRTPLTPSNIEIGDFVVARFTKSQWASHLPWEKWHHVAMISQLNPLKVIEVTGILLQKEDKNSNKKEIREGVVEHELNKTRAIELPDGSQSHNGNIWLFDSLEETLWLKPTFPNPIREIAKWYVPRIVRKKITEDDARKRVVEYARKQIGEPYDILSSKWTEKHWYCSLLIYKSYSRNVTGMYLETYNAGPMVTPEDLVDSDLSRAYFKWEKEK